MISRHWLQWLHYCTRLVAGSWEGGRLPRKIIKLSRTLRIWLVVCELYPAFCIHQKITWRSLLSIILIVESLHQVIAASPATGVISNGKSLQFRILLRMGCHISNPYHVLRLHKLVIIVTLGTTGYFTIKYISLSLADLQRSRGALNTN